MNTYLAIITTVLVITQIVRLIQNAAQLHRQNVLFKKQLGQLANCNPTEQDFENQRKAYQMIVGYLEEKAQCKICDKDDASPVVRCKECIHSYDDLCGLCCTCGPYVDCVVQPEFYCAEGKRKRGARGVE